MLLPEGFKRHSDRMKEEVDIPQNDPAPPDVGSVLMPITDLDEVCHDFFSYNSCFILFIIFRLAS